MSDLSMLINGLKVVGKDIREVKLVTSGAGAAGCLPYSM